MRSLFGALLIAAFVFSGCSQNKKIDNKNLVNSAYEKTDKYISDFSGADFLTKYLVKLPEKFSADSTGYSVAYLEKIGKLNYSDIITFKLDKDFKILNARNIKGLPDCAYSPNYCEFNIDLTRVKKILHDNKLPNGIKPAEISSSWSEKEGRFIWRVMITEKEVKSPMMERSEGLRVLIDPATGEILKKEKWRIL
jgi:hypothetical protein